MVFIEFIQKWLVFGKEEPELPFLYVDKGKIGIETYMDSRLTKFPEAYKKQVIEFLKGVIKQLGEK